MIFSAKNEKGLDLCDMVLSGRKTITRRRSPVEVGKTRAVQRGRGKHSIARIKIISCEDSREWYKREIADKGMEGILDVEAYGEGFDTWSGLWAWIEGHYGTYMPTLYRIVFKLADTPKEHDKYKCPGCKHKEIDERHCHMCEYLDTDSSCENDNGGKPDE